MYEYICIGSYAQSTFAQSDSYTRVHAQHTAMAVILAKGQPFHLSDPSVCIKLQSEI